MDVKLNGFPVGESEILAYESRAWRKYGSKCRLTIDISESTVTLTYDDPDGKPLSSETIKRIRGERPELDSSEDFETLTKEDIWS